MQGISLFSRILVASLVPMLVAVFVGPLFNLHGGGLVGLVLLAIGVGCALAWWVYQDVATVAAAVRHQAQDAVHRIETCEQLPEISIWERTDELGQMVESVDNFVRSAIGQATEMRERQLRLEESSKLLQAVLASMAEGVIVLDERGHVLFANRAAREQLGIASRQIEGRLLSEVARSSDLLTVFQNVLNRDEQCRQEVSLERQRLTLEVSAQRLTATPRMGVLLVLHDVTELRRLEMIRRQFVSNVGHELKTPLTSIQAYADTLLEGGLEDEENNRQFVERIVEQSNRLQMMVQDMMRLARIESQVEAFSPTHVRVAEVVAECVEARQAVAAAKQIEMNILTDDDSLMAYVDRAGLRTILENLVNNALNYTGDGGAVSISWQPAEGGVEIQVEDDGIGIAREHQERIFERFYRVDRARNRAAGGTGLGLAIVKHLTTVFGGRIEVDSEVGQGSRFRIWLPSDPESDRTGSSTQRILPTLG